MGSWRVSERAPDARTDESSRSLWSQQEEQEEQQEEEEEEEEEEEDDGSEPRQADDVAAVQAPKEVGEVTESQAERERARLEDIEQQELDALVKKELEAIRGGGGSAP